MSNVQYSIVLPSYAEADNLQELLPKLLAIAQTNLPSFEIIIVDANTSIDNTQEICMQYKNVIYINRSPSNKYADAVRSGIGKAQGTYTIFMDSDGSHPPDFLPKMLKEVGSADLIIASRYISGGHTDNSMLLVFMSKILNTLYSHLLKINCNDISNSLRIYKTEQLKKLALHCDNFDVIQEILIKLIKSNPNFTITEIPFSFKKRLYGKSKRNLMIFVISYIKTLIKFLVILRHA